MQKLLTCLFTFLSICMLAQEGSFTQYQYTSKDSIVRPYILYTPKEVNQTVPKPLVVYLHGAVSSPTIKKDPLEYMKKSKLLELADKGQFHLLFSYGQEKATWFDAVGMDMVIGEIQEIKQKINIDENKIFLSGFSDGGSGVFYISMIEPELFAGFIAMNGSIRVAEKLGDKSLFPKNSNQKPIFVINTTEDMLYPLHQLTPTIEQLQRFNKNITYHQWEGNHEMSYLDKHSPEILSFISNTKKPDPTTLFWETDIANSSYQWIEIVKLNPKEDDKGTNYRINVLNDKADFGVKYDYSYQGEGLKIKSFKENSTLERMGAKPGDILLKMEGTQVNSPYSPYSYLFTKRAGQDTEVTLLRDDKKITLKGAFNQGKEYAVFQKSSIGSVKSYIDNHTLYLSTKGIEQLLIRKDKLPKKISKIILNDKVIPLNFDVPIEVED